MRWAAALLVMLAPAVATAESLECLSIDGQLRVDFSDRSARGVTIRTPADGARGLRTVRLAPSDVDLEILSESRPTVLVQGCDGQPSGTLAIVRTTTLTTRRVRVRLPGGGAFPANVIGRSSDGSALERDITCKTSQSVMRRCR